MMTRTAVVMMMMTKKEEAEELRKQVHNRDTHNHGNQTRRPLEKGYQRDVASAPLQRPPLDIVAVYKHPRSQRRFVQMEKEQVTPPQANPIFKQLSTGSNTDKDIYI